MNTLRQAFLAIIGTILLTHTAQAHYDPNIGRWPSRDPIGERGGVNLMAFIGNQPVGDYDVLGRQSGKKVGSNERPTLKIRKAELPVKFSQCGEFEFEVDWAVTEPAGSAGGFILQDVRAVWDIHNCDGTPIKHLGGKTSPLTYSEVWRVLPKSKRVQQTDTLPGSKDYFSWGGQDCTYGTIAMYGIARYYPDKGWDNLGGWLPGNTPTGPDETFTWSGDLFSLPTNPDWNGSRSKPITHQIKVKWNCCPNKGDATDASTKVLDNDPPAEGF